MKPSAPSRPLRACIAALFALGIAATAPSTVADAPVQKSAAVAPYSQGILWKIEGRRQAPSYLFGTIHLADPRVTQLPAPVQKAFEAAASLVTEMMPDLAGVAALQQAMLYQDARTLEDAVGPELYRDVRNALAERGLPPPAATKLKPWAAAVILSLPMISTDAPLDLQLQQRAAMAGKPVHGLESAQEQISVFNDLSAADQRALLAAAVHEHRLAGERIEAMLQAYLARDLARLEQMTETYAPREPALRDTLKRRLLTDRNQRMVERLERYLREGNAFVAVGAAHLPGDDGLLNLLARAGYRVHPVY